MLFTFLIILILLLILSILFSKIEIRIQDIDISTQRKKGKKISKDYKIQISILAFYKVKIFKININEEKIKKIKSNPKLEKINTDMMKNIKIDAKLNTNFVTILKDLKFKIQKLNLNLDIGTDDAALTAVIVGVLSSILGLILNNKKENKHIFNIFPIYSSENILKLKFNCIFTINLMHYIYKTILKERRNKNERKSSNRRTYAYNNE